MVYAIGIIVVLGGCAVAAAVHGEWGFFAPLALVGALVGWRYVGWWPV